MGAGACSPLSNCPPWLQLAEEENSLIRREDALTWMLDETLDAAETDRVDAETEILEKGIGLLRGGGGYLDEGDCRLCRAQVQGDHSPEAAFHQLRCDSVVFVGRQTGVVDGDDLRRG